VSETRRYYWLKLLTNYFDKEEMKVLQGMENGTEYCLFWIKLLMKAVTQSEPGVLRFKETIPYTPEMLATVTGTNVDTVRVALKLFGDMQMIKVMDDGAIWIEEAESLVGSESDSAQRVRLFRDKKRALLQCNGDVTEVKQIGNTELEIDIEKEIEKKTSTSSGPPLNTRAAPKTKLFFNFADSLWYGITDEQMALWAEAYPAVDIDLDLRQAGEWCKSHGARGHKKDWRRFAVDWLKRTQDKGGNMQKGEGTWKKKQYSR
jgi:predicted phage replisome organizer